MATPQSHLLGSEYNVKLSHVPFIALLGFPLIGTLIQLFVQLMIACTLAGIIVGMNWGDRIDPILPLFSFMCSGLVYMNTYLASCGCFDYSAEQLIRLHLLWSLYDIIRWATLPAALALDNYWLIAASWYIETMIVVAGCLILLVWCLIRGVLKCRQICKTEIKNYRVQV